ncbi:MAG TPA: squalene--hopene cyclase [Bryobacteraceae bacterium]|nr:squalene--hopene cyclase [Bryobacteraceae bacterium]
MSATLQVASSLEAAASQAIRRSAQWLLSLQAGNGHWCGELTADSTLESDYILFQLWLHPPQGGSWNPPTKPLIEKAAASILERQLPDGGFNIYVAGPSEISASVKAYTALKLSGLNPAGSDASSGRMRKLRDRILELGGIQAANSYTKINLSLFNLYPREACPTIPPEIALLPFDFLYQMSSWTRAIAVSLSIVHSSNPCRPAPAGFTLNELWKAGETACPTKPGLAPRFFFGLDRFLKWWEKHGIQSVRRKAIERAAEWMTERMHHSDGLGAIYPPMMYSVMALDVLGYPADDPLRVEALRQFDALMVDDGKRFFFQPCFSPIWDTAIAAFALAHADSDKAALGRAADWLLAKEVRRRGDWSVKRPHTEPSGWAFEYTNEFYPDVDDTAMVMLALSRIQASDLAAQKACHGRAIDWLLAMQSKDGGWAAFDADNNWHFLNGVPFADHNAMLDPSCADITGRTLEALRAHGLPREHSAIRRGVEWLVRNQEQDGSWYGRWGVAYIYGTCFALRGLAAAGESDREAYILRAGEWLRAIQNADGGWGESCASYDNGAFTPGPSTPSQTAWAILGLLAGGDTESRSVIAGVEYLLRTQRPDGAWDEELATGTGFPKVFYLNYHLYKDYFPLLALASFKRSIREAGPYSSS